MNIVFDFDSTIVTIESLDFVISHITNGKFDKQIEEITNQGMNGEIDLKTSIQKRLNICNINQNIVDDVSKLMINYITKGIKEVVESLHKNGDNIFIVSGGLMNLIKPVAEHLAIPLKNCMANEVFFSEDGKFVGLNLDIPLLYKNGKSNALQKMNILSSKTVIIGDGFTDLEVNLNNPQIKFIGFGINIVRDVVQRQSKYYAKTMQEFKNILHEISIL